MKYELVRPIDFKNFANSGLLFKKTKCKVDDCLNFTFGIYNKCALHCEKNSYEIDCKNGLLTAFNNMLNTYIIDKLLSIRTPDLKNIGYRNELINYRQNKIPLHKLIKYKLNLSERTVLFEFIIFPEEDYLSYLESLKLFKGVWFVECIFSTSNFNLDSTQVYFKKCNFKNDFNIDKPILFKIESEFIFRKCEFESKVYIDLKDETEKDKVIEDSLFEECDFRGVISLSNANFNKEVFKFKPMSNKKYENSKHTQISSLIVDNVIFNDKCKFNYINIVNLVIRDTKFLSKLEVKNSIVSYFELNNSNISEVFDSFDSNFVRFLFYKSIFSDFSGFEKVNFGLKGNVNDLYVARFVYTTFMSFSNFRGTNFLSGLDFENSNLKEQPNFLKTYIMQENTNRETFRIVKHSFDDVGNKIEANRFFINEMQAYEKELNNNKHIENGYVQKLKEKNNHSEAQEYKKTKIYKECRRARWVFNANKLISEFGENYLRPIFILVVSVVIYTLITLWNKWYFKSHDYFMSWERFDTISKFFNEFAINILPFRIFIKDRNGVEFISLFFYIWFAVLIWQIIVSVKRHTQR